MTATPLPGRTRLLGIALLVVTFVAGATSGAAFDRLLGADPATDRAAATARAETGARRGHRGEADLFDHLDLTPDQRARIDAILAVRKQQMDAFWEEEGPQLREIIDATRAEIGIVLTAEQKAEYDRLRAERRARDREQRAGAGVEKETSTR